MGNFIGKLLNSSGTLTILSLVALGIWMNNLDNKIAVPKKTQGRSIEEIIQGTADNTQEPAWDNDFKSSVIKDAQ